MQFLRSKDDQELTLGLLNLLLGSNRSSPHFREFELTAVGQEHIKMTVSYEDNRLWQVTSHHIQIYYL